LHACRLAELLDIPSIIIPPTPGVLSTAGLLSTDLKNDYVQTCYQEGPEYDPVRVTAVFAELAEQALTWLEAEQVPPQARQLLYAADLRYAHQSFELTCPVATGHATPTLMRQLVAAFHREHQRLYSYDLPNAPVELVNLRVTALGVLPKLQTPSGRAASTSLDSPPAGIRSVYFEQRGGYIETPCYRRAQLAPGMSFEGPAIVDQDDTTTVVFPGFHASVDAVGNLTMTHRIA
jgi:N-methylhydantoinase A